MQEEHTQINETAWNQMAYEAWSNRFGTPSYAAAKIKEDPIQKLGLINDYFGNVEDKKIANLLGSHGTKAVSLALLGGDLTVVDFSYENSRYALDLAREAGVKINYIVSDVLKLDKNNLTGDYDIVFCEMGILHYFTDLHPFFNIAIKLLRKGGIFIIEDFHPVSTKLISSKGKRHKVSGDYFSSEIEETEVAFMKFIPGLDNLSEVEKNAFQKAHLRKWTLGEIITSIADTGFLLKTLKEYEGPKPEDKGIPKLFIISAEKL